MTPYGLKERHMYTHPESHFFDRDTLKFFGERMSEMHVLKKTVRIKGILGEEHECYVLTSLQHKAPGGPKRVSHYFDAFTYEQVIV